jgi:hypothetical protein
MYGFLANENWPSGDRRLSRDRQQLGQAICGQILALQDKSTMNLFAIDSLKGLREDKLGAN